MTRSLDQLWRSSQRRAKSALTGPTLVERTPDRELLHRMRGCLRAVIDWFTEY